MANYHMHKLGELARKVRVALTPRYCFLRTRLSNGAVVLGRNRAGFGGLTSQIYVFADVGKGIEAYKKADYEQARAEFERSAKEGSPSGLYRLALLYDQGRGVKEDNAKAFALYRQAAEKGHQLAQYNLALMYDEGEGLPEDNKEAARWYRAAAVNGSVKAKVNLGVLYSEGEGVEYDMVQAYAWTSLAAEAGEPAAVGNLEEFKSRLKPRELEKAKEVAAEFMRSME